MNKQLGHSLPIDVVNIILKYVLEFHRRDAIERIGIFRSSYSAIWTPICSDIRSNVPRYNIYLTTHSGSPLYVSIYSPNCEIRRLMSIIPILPSPSTDIIRRALSIHRNIVFYP